MAIPFRALALLAALSSAAFAAPAAPVVTQASQEEPLPPLPNPGIAMESRSWGKLIASFSIDANGDGEYREVQAAPGSSTFYDYDVQVKAFRLGPHAFAKLKEMVRPIAERTGGKPFDCGQVPPDGPYGTFSWAWEGSNGRLPFKYGCRTAIGAEAIRQMEAVEKVVIDWVKPLPVTRLQQVRQPQGN